MEQRRLLVFAEPKVQEAVKAALEKMEVATEGDPDRQVKVYRLRRASAELVLPILQAIAPHAEIVADPQAQRIVARANPAEQQAIGQLIEQFDPREGTGDGPLLQVYTVTQPAPADLLGTLSPWRPEPTSPCRPTGNA